MRTKALVCLVVNLFLVVMLSAVLAMTAHALTISGNKVDVASENESSEIELRVSSGAGNTPLLHGTNAGGTLAIPTYTPNNRTLLSVGGQGHDGSMWTNGSSANIRFRSTENWSPTGHGSEIRFGTTQNGSLVNTERMRITNDGKIGIGTSSPTQALDVAGNVNTSGTVTATTFTGSGPGLTNLNPMNIASGTANINISGNAATATTATTATTANAVAVGSVSTDGLSSGAVTPVKIAFLGNVAIVAPSGGDYTDPVTAMADLSMWCGTPSATNPCLLKIMPGIYDIGPNTLQMQQYVDIEGSGENTTKISGYIDSSSSGVVRGASKAEIRLLTAENSGGGANKIAIYNSSASPKITNVTATALTGFSNNYGIYNTSSSPEMTNVTAIASGGNGTCAGVYNTSSSPAMINVRATASGGTNWNSGVYNISSSSPTMIHVTATASGQFAYAVYNYGSSPLLMNVTATSLGGGSSGHGVRNYSSSPDMMNVKAVSSGATLENVGVYNESSSPQMMNVIATGSGGQDTCGVRNDASSPTLTNVTAMGYGGSMYNRGVYSRTSGIVTINHSLIVGSFQTILNNANAITRVGNTKLDGGSVTGGGVTCAGVYDENYTFYASTCP